MVTIQINEKFEMHYACEEDAEWMETILGEYNPSYNDRANPSRFGVIFTERGVRILWLGLSAESGKLTVTKAVVDPSFRDTGYFKEVAEAAIAWLENSKLHETLIIPVQNNFNPIIEGFERGAAGFDGMRADTRLL